MATMVLPFISFFWPISIAAAMADRARRARGCWRWGGCCGTGKADLLNGGAVPAWAVVALCGVLNQVLKLILYSVARKRVALTAVAQGNGLPSLPASLLACLTVLVSLRSGWGSPEAGFALVFAVIVVHDTLKMGWLADRQREVLVHLLDHLDERAPRERRALEYLDPRAHHPAHVAVGLVLGGVFALAFGIAPS